jgi:hypothetical protein
MRSGGGGEEQRDDVCFPAFLWNLHSCLFYVTVNVYLQIFAYAFLTNSPSSPVAKTVQLSVDHAGNFG